MVNDNKGKLSRGTGRSLEGWMEHLHTHGAEDLNDRTHQDTARLAKEGGASPWWAQSVAVAVEQAIGRRRVGETTGETVNVSASRTVSGEWREIVARGPEGGHMALQERLLRGGLESIDEGVRGLGHDTLGSPAGREPITTHQKILCGKAAEAREAGLVSRET